MLNDAHNSLRVSLIPTHTSAVTRTHSAKYSRKTKNSVEISPFHSGFYPITGTMCEIQKPQRFLDFFFYSLVFYM